jgi:hypothetical protein
VIALVRGSAKRLGEAILQFTDEELESGLVEVRDFKTLYSLYLKISHLFVKIDCCW